MRMIDQVAIGMALTIGSTVFSGLVFWLAETFFTRHRHWLRRPPHWTKMFLVVSGTAGLVFCVLMTSVALWSVAIFSLGLFGDFATSFYFALVSYTTVGFGNVMPDGEWRLLGAMAAANGFINIGLLTTLLIEGLGHVREGYRRSLEGDDRDAE